MTKLLLASALLAGTFAFAEQKQYEISPMVGYNFAEDSLGFKDDGYMTYGLELQYNDKDWFISPELSFIYSRAEFDTNAKTHALRTAINGVKGFNEDGLFQPFVKAGVGYDYMNNGPVDSENSLFVDAGAGLKVPFTDSLAFKLEAIYMLKENASQNTTAIYDNNVIIHAGLTYAFGSQEQKKAPIVTDGDDDKDGILNSKDKCPNSATGIKVDADGCFLDSDDDKDGVLNSKDKCANSAAGIRVDTDGCFLDSDDDKDGVLNAADKCPSTPTGTKVDTKGCTIDNDIDKDGVLNAVDKCPDTLPGATVNNNGCAESAVLDVLFKNNSFEVLPESHLKIQEVADFLKRHTNYSAKIIGYTDSRGSAKYNQSISEKRANAVKELLIQKGAPAKNLSSLGRGEESPIADNMLKEGRAKNRRVEAEFTIN